MKKVIKTQNKLVKYGKALSEIFVNYSFFNRFDSSYNT